MVQVKKADVREAILDSAFELFSEKDYASTSLSQIAKRAGASTSNLYVYFPSKLDLLWAVLRPWLFRQIDQLELELQGIEDGRARVERILHVLWGEIPAADNNLAINLVQGVALSKPEDNYSRDLLLYLEQRLTVMLRDSLPEDRKGVLGDSDAFSHLAFMAFDGFVLTTRVKGRSKRLTEIVRITSDLLFGTCRTE
ncbi:MAG: TetR/AcrR family transcriptional regulator [Alphaproteobacteria bacterium]|nr:TetR/AcrR family transcriptional regulator [Alphaproteobacteria bacterium]